MAAAESQNRTSYDRACNHCRERKIRCGRERPQCANCKRDGVECGYYSPGKRVNHIKLLCDNVDGLDGRLCNIEGEISNLTALLKTTGSRRTSLETAADDDSSFSLSGHEQSDSEVSPSPPNRHIVRSHGDLVDRYHGPCTLFALCNEISATVISQQADWSTSLGKDGFQIRNGGYTSPRGGLIEQMLTRMCLDAGIEESFDLKQGQPPASLPPKRLLHMVQSQFFQNADYTTDIFLLENFSYNMERVYSQPLSPADEGWAICFNTIILLVLGTESTTPGSTRSQFVSPLLEIVSAALNNSRVLMSPKLVNVQALALLSIAAQQYHPSGFAESIFAQACVLARTMGLHQTDASSDGISPEESQERSKVLTSLYLRDKSLAISRGSICWLPSFDCGFPADLHLHADSKSQHSARNQLASLQEDIYRLFHSAESKRQSSSKFKRALFRIEQDLNQWAKIHDVFGSTHRNPHNVALQLEYLACRISAFHGSPEYSHARIVLDDARASCLLLLIFCGRQQYSAFDLEKLLPRRSAPNSPDKSSSARCSRQLPMGSLEQSSRASNTPPHTPLPAPGFGVLLDAFSVPAFFLLSKHVLSSPLGEGNGRRGDDLTLLRNTCICYKELGERVQANNYAHKVARAFEQLLAVIDVIDTRDSQALPTTSNLDGHPQQTIVPITPRPTPDQFLHQDQADFVGNMPYDLSQAAFNMMNGQTSTAELGDIGVLPEMYTGLDSDMFAQNTFDSGRLRSRTNQTHTQLSTDDYIDFVAESPMRSY